MNKVTAPFTEEQVKNINDYQQSGLFHPFTCCSHEGCIRSEHDDGVLIASTMGLICPCGNYKQYWVHEGMSLPSEDQTVKHFYEDKKPDKSSE